MASVYMALTAEFPLVVGDTDDDHVREHMRRSLSASSSLGLRQPEKETSDRAPSQRTILRLPEHSLKDMSTAGRGDMEGVLRSCLYFD
jgi:hypothetical protein